MINHSTNFKNFAWLKITSIISVISGMFSASLAFAGENDFGVASEWQIDTQAPATDMMSNMISFHNLLLWVTGLTVLFVGVLLLIVIFKYNTKSNPIPAKFTHNTFIENVWTVLPIMILVIIAIPSFDLLYKQRVIPTPEMTIKITGNQWYWSYEYADQDEISFDSIMIPENEITGDQIRLLSVDNEMVVPVDTTVRIVVTSNPEDVIHAWTIPSFGVKIDAIPGRLNEAWFKANRKGVYYGQCSELCGRDHAYMPIAVRVVSKEDFAKWVEEAKVKYASSPITNVIKVAAL
ncbi:MAG: cytochrome c oxidase subunit II [Rhizobiales bacterium]|nr:cytochrome c oxidase subunit II [Hyphomicrobiales bacterium]